MVPTFVWITITTSFLSWISCILCSVVDPLISHSSPIVYWTSVLLSIASTLRYAWWEHILKLRQRKGGPPRSMAAPTLVPLPKRYVVLDTIMLYEPFYGYLIKLGLQERGWSSTIDKRGTESCRRVKDRCSKSIIRLRHRLARYGLLISSMLSLSLPRVIHGLGEQSDMCMRIQDGLMTHRPPTPISSPPMTR